MTGQAPTVGPNQGLLLTLSRGIQVLETIARDEGDATAKSLAGELEMNLGTCYQLLRTLRANGYVQSLPGGRYGLGTRIGYLADYYENAVAPPPKLMEILHELHDRLQETVYISIKRGGELPISAVLEGTRMLRVGTLTVGFSGDPHIRASTKAYLAHVDMDTLDEVFDGADFESKTPNTITDWDTLLAELETTRKRGYGTDNEEYLQGVSCLGAVILDEEGNPYGAFGTSLPTSRFLLDEKILAGHIMDAGIKASRALGYQGTYRTEVI